MRFRNYHSDPPGGLYFFAMGDDFVDSTSRSTICDLVRGVYRKQGRVAPFDPFEVVMAHMCPSMPEGFCTGTRSVPSVDVSVIKENTRSLFGKRVADPVVIQERLHTCLSCKENSRAVCPSCCGLTDWVVKGMKGRSRVPADNFAFVCRPAQAFVSALVTAENPGPTPEGCPENCWRHHVNTE